MNQSSCIKAMFRIKDVTQVTGLQKSTIYQYIKAGKLKLVKLGGGRASAVPRDSLISFVESTGGSWPAGY